MVATRPPFPAQPRGSPASLRPFPALPSSLLFSPLTWATTACRSSSPRSSSPGLGQGREAREPALRLMSRRCQQESRVPGRSGLGLSADQRLSSPVFIPTASPVRKPGVEGEELWCRSQKSWALASQDWGAGRGGGGSGEQGEEEEVKKAQVSCLGCTLVAGSTPQTDFIYMHICGI